MVPQLVGEQVLTRPEAPALVAGSRTLTYAEMDRRANQLAHYLRGLGVGPEKLVALCVERSPEMVIAALAVLKAGGAYLPQDPGAPVERNDATLRDADISVLVTEAESVLCSGAFRSVSLERDGVEIARQPVEAPVASVTPENLAYVIYTSGLDGSSQGSGSHSRQSAQFVELASAGIRSDGCGSREPSGVIGI